ncbi:MAG: hypothetical protein HY717_00545 [Planctomycetes bacterium]|nr:hypothetical protein [Planctomycetota bacterium]
MVLTFLAMVFAIPLLLFFFMTLSRVDKHRSGPATVSRAPHSQAPVPPPSSPYPVHLSDDLAAWKKLDAVAPKEAAKPWVLDAAGSTAWAVEGQGLSLIAWKPGPGWRLAGYSRDLEPALETARLAADRSALGQLAALLLWELSGRRGSIDFAFKDAEVLVRQTLHARFESRLVADRFEEAVPLAAGTVYRAAVLVKADPQILQELSAELVKGIQEGKLKAIKQRREFLINAASAAGLAIFIFLAYAFLNAGTKGHFAWPLRIFSLLALALLYLGFFWMRGWILP